MNYTIIFSIKQCSVVVKKLNIMLEKPAFFILLIVFQCHSESFAPLGIEESIK